MSNDDASSRRRGPEVRPLTIDPGRQFGRVCVNGTRIPATIIAENVRAGDDMGSLVSDYGISRTDVLLCCWWWVDEGHLGQRRGNRKVKWHLWADRAHSALGGWEGHVVDLCSPDD